MGVGGPGPGCTRVMLRRCNKPSNRLNTSLHCLSRHFSVPCPRLGKLLASVNARRLNRLRVVNTVICRLAHGLARRRVGRNNFSTCFMGRAAKICPTKTGNIPFGTNTVTSGKSIVAGLRRGVTTRRGTEAACSGVLELISSPSIESIVGFLHRHRIIRCRHFNRNLEVTASGVGRGGFCTFGPDFSAMYGGGAH